MEQNSAVEDFVITKWRNTKHSKDNEQYPDQNIMANQQWAPQHQEIPENSGWDFKEITNNDCTC